jgi:ATP-dependent DNA ligase
VERRQILLDVLADAGPPIVPVWSTTDLDEALLWYEALEGTRVEGIVAKPLRGAYTAGRMWAKIRHADTIEAAVAGFTGTARHPKALAVRLPDGRVAMSQRLTTALSSTVAPHLVPQTGRALTKAGDSYTPAVGDVVVQVVAGTTRHAVVTVTRLR